MTRHLLSTLAALVLAAPLSVTSVAATTIVIDDFTVNQDTVRANAGPTSGSVCGAPTTSIIGGCRYLQVATSQGQDGTSLGVDLGALSFNNGAVSTGTGWIIYDGNGDRDGLGSVDVASVNGVVFGANVYTSGLGGQDLLRGQETGFFTVEPANFDQDEGTILNFAAFAWDTFGNAVSYFEAIDLTSFSPILGYNEFAGSAGFRWDSIGALAFRVDSRNVAFDGQIRSITATPIPLPASALLLLGGLGGMAGWSMAAKRRRKS